MTAFYPLELSLQKLVLFFAIDNRIILTLKGVIPRYLPYFKNQNVSSLQISLSLNHIWPVNESVSIEKKEDRNPESNRDLEPRPFVSWSLSLTTTLPHLPADIPKNLRT